MFDFVRKLLLERQIELEQFVPEKIHKKEFKFKKV